MGTTETLRELLAAATRGPWSSGHNEGWDAPRGYHVWFADNPEDDEDGIFVAYTGRGGVSCADAKLIAATRNALPALLDVVEAVKRASLGMDDGDGTFWDEIDDAFLAIDELDGAS